MSNAWPCEGMHMLLCIEVPLLKSCLGTRRCASEPWPSFASSIDPAGPLALAIDNSVWDISATSIVQRQFVPLLEKAGYEFTGHPRTYDLYTNDVATYQRPPVVYGDLSVFELPTAPAVSAAGR